MKITKIEKITLDSPIPVYDLEVSSDLHNFPLNCGCSVHNCTNALSEYFEVWSSGLHIVWNRGIKVSEDRDWKLPEGFTEFNTVVRFKPDSEIFTNIHPSIDLEQFKYTKLILHELGKDNTHIIVNGEEFNQELTLPRFNIKYGGTYVDGEGIKYPYNFSVYFDWEIGRTWPSIDGSVNGLHTPMGSHVSWILNIIKIVVAQKLKISDKELLSLGLNLFVVVMASEVSYTSQTKEKLAGVYGFDGVECHKVAESEINRVINENKDFFDRLKKSIDIYMDSTKRAAEVREINNLLQGTLDEKPKNRDRSRSKLSATSVLDCTTTNRNEAELFICEGKSAAATLIKGRNSKYHAILPLRGRPFSAYKSSYQAMLQNVEWLNLVLAVGGGIDKLHNLNKVRYGKVIVTCFTGDTKVPLLDGRTLTLEEISKEVQAGFNLYTYSINDELGLPVPGYILNAGKTGTASKLVHIILDNDKEIKCTLDHKFLTPDLEYIEAKDLKVGQSLFPIYRGEKTYKYSKDRQFPRESIFIPGMGWQFTHSIMSGLTYMKFNGDNLNCVTHHIDHNYKNNSPENLVIMDAKDHGSMHLTEYNKSEERINYIKWLHANHKYDHVYQNLINWNKSDERKEKLRKYWNEGRLVSNGELIKFNKSIEHRESMKGFNNTDWVKDLQKMGRVRSKFKKLLDSGIDFEDALIEIQKDHRFYLFKDIEGFKTEWEKRNHKIKSIEIIELSEPIDVYCLEIPESHNFLLDAGVVVHNCDSDSDGANIAISLLGGIATHMRYLIDAGKVYILQTPLYLDTRTNTYYYPGQESQVDFGSGKITRFKGLGEFNASQFKDFAFNPDKRSLIQVTSENLEEALYLMRYTGPKKELMESVGAFESKMIDEEMFDKITYTKNED